MITSPDTHQQPEGHNRCENIFADLNEKISSEKTHINFMIDTIIKNANDSQLKLFDQYLVDYFSFLNNESFQKFLNNHYSHIMTQFSKFNINFIKLSRCKEWKELNQLNEIRDNQTKINSTFEYFFDKYNKVIDIKIDSIFNNAKNYIEKIIKQDSLKKSRILYQLIFKKIELQEEILSKEIILNIEQTIQEIINIIEIKHEDLFYGKLKILIQLLTIQNITQNEIDSITEYMINKPLDTDEDIDLFLYENATNETILFELFKIIKGFFEEKNEYFNRIKNELQIKFNETDFCIIYQNTPYKFSFGNKIKIFKNESTINISLEEFDQYFSHKYNDVEINSKYFFISLLKTFKTGMTVEHFCQALDHNLRYDYKKYFEIFDKNEIKNCTQFFINNLSQDLNTREKLLSVFTNIDEKIKLNDSDWHKIILEPCVNLIQENKYLKEEEFFFLQVFLKHYLKHVLLIAQIENNFFYSINTDNFFYSVDQNKQNGFDVINQQLGLLYEQKRLKEYFENIIANLNEMFRILNIAFDNFKNSEEKHKVPDFFYAIFIFGYENLFEDLVNQDLSIIYDRLILFVNALKNPTNIDFFKNFKSNAIKAEELAKKIQPTYKNYLKLNFEKKYNFFMFFSKNILKNIDNSEINIENILSINFADLVVRLVLLKEQFSIDFLQKISELYINITYDKSNKDVLHIKKNEIQKDLFSYPPSKYKSTENGIPEFEEIYFDYNEKLNKEKFVSIINTNNESKSPTKLKTGLQENIQINEKNQSESKIRDQKINEQINSKNNIVVDNHKKNLCDSKEDKNGIIWIFLGIINGIGILIIILLLFLLS
ncbi:hypothetical protein GVAV_000967 [Gurleya vavrai]